MLELSLGEPSRKSLFVLCLGAHPDDIEIGCGGTILDLCRSHDDITISWVVFSGRGARVDEARASANAFLEQATHKEVMIKEFRDGFFPYQGGDIKQHFESLKASAEPDIVFTHYRDDRHQDHRLLHELTWNTWRNHLILEYEVPKYDGDLGIPNVFSHLSEETLSRKIDLLHEHFPSQSGKHWFSTETFRALPRLRGMECARPYAEAFYVRKLVMQAGR